MLCLVTARLSSPIAAMHPLHLDGLVAAASTGRGTHLMRQSPAEEITVPDMPIVMIHAMGTWCHLASAWMFPPEARRGREVFVTRKDAEDIEARAGVWHATAGPEKSRHVVVPTIETPSVAWYVVCNRRGLLKLLQRITHIGMLRRQGYGAVTDWDVVAALPSGLPPWRVLVEALPGRAARHLPAEWCRGAEPEYGAYRLPYWHPARTREMRVPLGSPCGLRPGVLDAMATVV